MAFGVTSNLAVEEPVEKKKEEPKDVKTSDDEIKQLNLGVLKWIRLCLDNDPICDLRPVFEDYKKYIDKLDKVRAHMTIIITQFKTDYNWTTLAIRYNMGWWRGRAHGNDFSDS